MIERALGALQAVDCEQESFTNDPRIRDMVMQISRLTWDMKSAWNGVDLNAKNLYRC